MTEEFVLETNENGQIHPTALWAVTTSPRYDAVHKQLAGELKDTKNAFSDFACQVMAVAIAGMADSAIISNQSMNEWHAFAWVLKLAAYARELRSGEALLKSVAALPDFDDDEYPGDVDEVFDAGVRQGRIDLAREILKLQLEQKDEEARRGVLINKI